MPNFWLVIHLPPLMTIGKLGGGGEGDSIIDYSPIIYHFS